MSEAKTYNAVIDGDLVTVETGKLARLAGGAVTIRQGDTVLLVTATMSKKPREGISFFPLSVDFEERLYAAGRIPGSFFRREGRPSEGAILTCRLTDRPLRPLFPKDFRNEVQIIITALSVDQRYQPDIMAVVGASAALTISDIPFGAPPYEGPIGAVRVGLIDGEFVANPTFEQMEDSTLDLRVAGTRDAILMVECGAQEVPEDMMVAALNFAHAQMQPLIDLQEQMAQEVGKAKITDWSRFAIDEAVKSEVTGKVRDQVVAVLGEALDKDARDERLRELEEELVASYEGREEVEIGDVRGAFHDVVKSETRRRIVDDHVRPDGRGLTEIRPLSAETGLSPRAHGSGLFTRGETQVLSLATLGTPRDEQRLDTLSPVDSKRYLHHYNFPPFSTGETWFLRGPKRREIGHGALAETALRYVLPAEEDFPYTLRVVSEVLSSNGSTSMASVCGSTLALMDAGVPIKKPVGGIAMGLVKEGDKYAVLTDIQGMEDHIGDMDFKVAGTDAGITALQMDIKVTGITPEIMSQALSQARTARMQILQTIADHLPAPRTEMSPFAPRMTIVQVPVDKIGAIIGPGGKTIRAIQDETGAKIDIEEDGRVFIAAAEGPAADEARARIEALTESAEIGMIYTGRVVRVTDFGAFVEIIPGTEGLVHISQLADYRVERVEDVAREGDELTVMVTEIRNDGKVRLSRQAVLEGWTAEEARERDRPPSRGGRSRGGGNRGGRGGNRGGSSRGGGRRPG
ncbi:MAG: polyribonucleotide nucleotidyltransferase [Anaerolineales bacterium]